MEEIKIKEEIVTDQSLFAYEIKKEFCKSEQQVNDNLDYYSLQLKSENPDVKYGICHDELLIKSEDDDTTTNQPWAPHDYQSLNQNHVQQLIKTDSVENLAYFDEGMQVDQTESESSDKGSFITETESFQYTTNTEHVTSESTGSEKDEFTSNIHKLQTERVEHVLENINITEEFRNVPSTDAQQNNAFLKINIQGNYSKKPWTRERPTICPICHKDVITHFTRHLFKHHKDNEQVIKIKSLPPKSKERLALVSALRKQGYFHLKTEKNILSPVRTSKTPNTKYFVCIYCLGHYSKSLLYKHVKICKQKPTSEIDPGKNCLTKSQTFLATMTSKDQNFLKSTRIKDEVFGIMRADEISLIAKSDALICLFGEALLNKHKRQQIFTVISNKMREMGRLLIALRLINDSIDVLFDALKPERFQDLISATKEISGYDPVSKCYKSPSLALHIGTNLKVACDIALEIVLENRNLPKIQWENGDLKKQEIEDTKELIERHWCAKISSIALKVLKERQWEKPNSLTNDIQAFQTYVNNLASESYDNIVNKRDVLTNYTVLTECVLALTIMFNRKCVGDIQCLKITTYNKNWDTTSFIELLTNVEKIISQKCKIVLTYDKGLQPLLILFPSQIQKYITLMLEVRKHLGKVLKSNPFLFSNSRSANKYIAAYHAIKKLAPNCGVKNPSFLTSTKFKKRIATTLQLLAMNENELEQVATLMGHTEETHTEFYRLPEDIYQTAKVAKVLMLLEKGKGNQFKAKSLNEIDFDNDVYCSSESDNEDTCCKQFHRPNTESCETDEPEPGPSQIEHPRCVEPKPMKSGRVRWTEAEKRIVKSHFKSHIENKITPKKDECNKLLVKHANIFMNKDWARVKIFVYNVFRDK